jgi:hypothetical protein
MPVEPSAADVTWVPASRMTGIQDSTHRMELDATVPGHRIWITREGYEDTFSREIKGDEGRVNIDVRLEAARR